MVNQITISVNKIENGFLVTSSQYAPQDDMLDYNYTPPVTKQYFVENPIDIGATIAPLLSQLG